MDANDNGREALIYKAKSGQVTTKYCDTYTHKAVVRLRHLSDLEKPQLLSVSLQKQKKKMNGKTDIRFLRTIIITTFFPQPILMFGCFPMNGALKEIRTHSVPHQFNLIVGFGFVFGLRASPPLPEDASTARCVRGERNNPI
ncbi:hypothetical protein TNCV_4830311 [Trichonephila clavipes]|nr:hypothetical protein TNCV_4830311 [Trichonephila clavipes]